MKETEDFLAALSHGLAPEHRLIVCGFGGDPGVADPTAWKPRPWLPGRDLLGGCGLGARWNAYVTIASFGRAEDRSYRRRGSTFAAGHAIMVDDVGTKVDQSIVADVPPTAIVETSPGNHQYWYMFRAPELDAGRYDGLIRAFISGKLLGADPGMAGITRVGRLPGFYNNKKAYAPGFQVQLKLLAPIVRYSVDELLAAFNLKINGTRAIKPRLASEEAIERNRLFLEAYNFLHQRGMLKRADPDRSGWIEITCPWVDHHTHGVDNGAAIREPAEENQYYGAFRCHHGHCIDKGWAEMQDWINDLAIEEIEAANRQDDMS
jgi:hypothetical protein